MHEQFPAKLKPLLRGPHKDLHEIHCRTIRRRTHAKQSLAFSIFQHRHVLDSRHVIPAWKSSRRNIGYFSSQWRRFVCLASQLFRSSPNVCASELTAENKAMIALSEKRPKSLMVNGSNSRKHRQGRPNKNLGIAHCRCCCSLAFFCRLMMADREPSCRSQ